MQTKKLLTFLLPLLLLLGGLATRPVQASTQHFPLNPPTLILSPAAQEENVGTESSEASTGLLVGLGGAALVILLTGMGVLLNRQNRHDDK